MVEKDRKSRAIGIFDSGFGGLTIMKSLIRAMPFESIIYFGDSINAPYGDKSKEEIIRLTLEGARFLCEKKIKALVIACGTACVCAYRVALDALDVPIVEIISPSLELILRQAKNKKIGVAATRATIRSRIYRKQILEKSPLAKVYSLSCPLLVPLIEDGLADKNEMQKKVLQTFRPLMSKKVDFILLACTHYPLIKNMIQKAVGSKVKVIDPSDYIAREVGSFLKRRHLMAENTNVAKYQFYTSGDTDRFRVIAKRFLGKKIDKIKKK